MRVEHEIGRAVAAALLVTPDGRYLMQHRDDFAWIMLPDHWALFGGSLDAGETPEAALRRELVEELGFAAREVAYFSELVIHLPMQPPRFDRMHFLAVPIAERDIAGMVVHEGAGMALFTPEALAAQARVAPWDLAMVMMHARRTALFPQPP